MPETMWPETLLRPEVGQSTRGWEAFTKALLEEGFYKPKRLKETEYAESLKRYYDLLKEREEAKRDAMKTILKEYELTPQEGETMTPEQIADILGKMIEGGQPLQKPQPPTTMDVLKRVFAPQTSQQPQATPATSTTGFALKKQEYIPRQGYTAVTDEALADMQRAGILVQPTIINGVKNVPTAVWTQYVGIKYRKPERDPAIDLALKIIPTLTQFPEEQMTESQKEMLASAYNTINKNSAFLTDEELTPIQQMLAKFGYKITPKKKLIINTQSPKSGKTPNMPAQQPTSTPVAPTAW